METFPEYSYLGRPCVVLRGQRIQPRNKKLRARQCARLQFLGPGCALSEVAVIPVALFNRSAKPTGRTINIGPKGWCLHL